MKLPLAIALMVMSTLAISHAQDRVGRYQIAVAQAGKDWMMPQMIFKIDTATGQTWVYEFAFAEVPDKYRTQFPKGIRAEGWNLIPDNFGFELGKAMKFPEGYIPRPAAAASP